MICANLEQRCCAIFYAVFKTNLCTKFLLANAAARTSRVFTLVQCMVNVLNTFVYIHSFVLSISVIFQPLSDVISHDRGSPNQFSKYARKHLHKPRLRPPSIVHRCSMTFVKVYRHLALLSWTVRCRFLSW